MDPKTRSRVLSHIMFKAMEVLEEEKLGGTPVLLVVKDGDYFGHAHNTNMETGDIVNFSISAISNFTGRKVSLGPEPDPYPNNASKEKH